MISCTEKKETPEPNRFAGLWSLHIMEERDSLTGKWSECRNGMQGYLFYDDKDNMAVHLTTKGYENTPLTLHGRWLSTPESRIPTRSMWNEVDERRYTFNGDTLILEPVERQNARLRLKWVRERAGGAK